MLEGSFFADSGAMVAIYVLLGLACADQRFFMPLPEPRVLPKQQLRAQQPAQRTPVAYMHHGLPHEHAGWPHKRVLAAQPWVINISPR